MSNPESIHMCNIIQTEQIIFRNVHAYTSTYMHLIIMQKGGHEFEGVQGGACRRVWVEERERRNMQLY